jgi:hypothetical protein
MSKAFFIKPYEMRNKHSKSGLFNLTNITNSLWWKFKIPILFSRPTKFNFRNRFPRSNTPCCLVQNTSPACFQLPKNKTGTLLAEFYCSFMGGHVISLCNSLDMQLKGLSLIVIQTATFTHDARVTWFRAPSVYCTRSVPIDFTY